MRLLATITLSLLVISTAHASQLLDDKVYRYHNAQVLKLVIPKDRPTLRKQQLVRGELWVKNGKIIEPQARADVSEDMKGLILAPGYIDVQINGGWGVDFSTNPERWKEVAKRLPEHGVTSFLATIVSSNREKYKECIRLLKPRTTKGQKGPLGCANLLGVHLEGPFLNKEKHGAHNEDHIVSELGDLSIEEFYGSLTGVRMITLAPEHPAVSDKALAALRKRGIIVAAGHSNATYGQMRRAMMNGVRMTTHLYNAMTPFHHRDPGVVAAVLQKPFLSKHVNRYSIIADGEHVHPGSINMAWSCNRRGLILVTDAMAALGLEDGDYKLGSMNVSVKDRKATIKGTETLAGSVLSMDRAVRNLEEFIDRCSPAQAIEAATLRPAKLLGITGQRGTLNIGSYADFIVLDYALRVQRTYIGNYLAFKRK